MQHTQHIAGQTASRLRAAALGCVAVAFAGLVSAACSVSSPNRTGASPAAAPTQTFASGNTASAEARPAALQRPPTSKAKIALLLPLSKQGQTGLIAKAMKQAGELALFEYKNPGLQLLVKDTAGTPEGARAAAEAALSSGAEIIIGPLFAASVRSVATIARPRGVPVVAFSSDETVAGPGVYLLSFQAHQEIDRVVSYVTGLGKRRFAALIPDNAYGKVMSAAFRSAVSRHGGELLTLETYPPGANGMLEKSQALFEKVAGAGDLGAPIEAVFVPGDASTLPTLGPIIDYAKVDTTQVTLIGNGGWDYRGIGRLKAFRGGLFASPDPAGWNSFTQKFVGAYGSAPPRIASFAYDGVAMAASLATRQSSGPRFGPANLTAPSGFTGVDGPVRFLASGKSERGLAVLTVTEFSGQVVDHAPAVFGASIPPAVQGYSAQAPALTDTNRVFQR